MHPCQHALLHRRQLRLTAPQLALGPGDGHSFTGAHPDQVDLELGERGEDVEEQLPHRAVGVVDLTAERQRHTAFGEGVTDVASIRNGSSKPVELRHHERVARAYRCQRLIEAGTLAFGAADPVVDVDATPCSPSRAPLLNQGIM
jgi:hypothetical protein